jgi:hypothetical protein
MSGAGPTEHQQFAAALEAKDAEIERLTELRATENVLAEGHIARAQAEIVQLREVLGEAIDMLQTGTDEGDGPKFNALLEKAQALLDKEWRRKHDDTI